LSCHANGIDIYAVGAWAQESIVDKVTTACEPEIKAYCSQVTLGEGRLLACFYAHEDTRTPFVINLFENVINIVLVPTWSHSLSIQLAVAPVPVTYVAAVPQVVVAVQHFEAVRRAWALVPELRPYLCEAWSCYAAKGHPAAAEGAVLGAPVPPPG
jgi:hypothetical protein